MTEEEWHHQTTPQHLLRVLSKQKLLTSRKSRLAACCFVRLVWDCIESEDVKAAVEKAEGRADRVVSQAELARIRMPPKLSADIGLDMKLRIVMYCLLAERVNPDDVATHLRIGTRDLRIPFTLDDPKQVEAVHDIFGNPFRPVAFDSA